MAGGLTPVELPGVFALTYNQISVGISATQIIGPRSGRRSLIIVNHGATDVFIGDSNVTIGTGLLLPGTKGASLSVPGSMDIWGIVGSGVQTISYLEIY